MAEADAATGDEAPVVFVVDDDAAMRDALEVLLRSTGFRVEVFATADEFLQSFDPGRPGCLVLDIRMPGVDGLELQRRLAAGGAEVPIVFLTGFGEVGAAARAFKMGAVDFLEKPFTEATLLAAIRQALERDHEARRHRGERRGLTALLEKLTAREWQVLEHFVAGKTTKQIALELGITPQAVDARRQRLFRKAGVDNVVELVRLVVAARPRPSGPSPGRGETPDSDRPG